MHHSDSHTGGRIFGPGFGRQPLLVSGNLTQTNMRKACHVSMVLIFSL